MRPLLLIAALLAASAHAGPPLPQHSAWGGAVVTWVSKGTHWAGRVEAGTPCGQEDASLLVEGDVEGALLVGQVTVCQAGPGCDGKSKRYPLFGFLQRGTLLASVRTDPHCTSPALKDDRLVLTPMPAKLAEGEILVHRSAFGRARSAFEEALRQNPDEPQAYYGLALATGRLRNRRNPQTLAYLQAAVDKGFCDADAMVRDFGASLGHEARFQTLVRSAREGHPPRPAAPRAEKAR